MKNLNGTKLTAITLLLTWLFCTWAMVFISYSSKLSMLSIGAASTLALALAGIYIYFDIKRQEKEQ